MSIKEQLKEMIHNKEYLKDKIKELRFKYVALEKEWDILDSQGDSCNYKRLNDIQKEMSQIEDEIKAYEVLLEGQGE